MAAQQRTSRTFYAAEMASIDSKSKSISPSSSSSSAAPSRSSSPPTTARQLRSTIRLSSRGLAGLAERQHRGPTRLPSDRRQPSSSSNTMTVTTLEGSTYRSAHLRLPPLPPPPRRTSPPATTTRSRLRRIHLRLGPRPATSASATTTTTTTTGSKLRRIHLRLGPPPAAPPLQQLPASPPLTMISSSSTATPAPDDKRDVDQKCLEWDDGESLLHQHRQPDHHQAGGGGGKRPVLRGGDGKAAAAAAAEDNVQIKSEEMDEYFEFVRGPFWDV
ncbi:MAG: hypothetical protein Q9227_001829 [Pyrenula ochraceoflavens]